MYFCSLVSTVSAQSDEPRANHLDRHHYIPSSRFSFDSFENSEKVGSMTDEPESLSDMNSPIYLNQSDNIYIVAKYGQTVSLPCNIFRQKNPDYANVRQTYFNKT